MFEVKPCNECIARDSLIRHTNWGDINCPSIWRNYICILSIHDLDALVKSNHFMANKFMLDYDPLAFQCMEEWIQKKIDNKLIIQMDIYCEYLKKYSSISKCP